MPKLDRGRPRPHGRRPARPPDRHRPDGRRPRRATHADVGRRGSGRGRDGPPRRQGGRDVLPADDPHRRPGHAPRSARTRRSRRSWWRSGSASSRTRSGRSTTRCSASRPGSSRAISERHGRRSTTLDVGGVIVNDVPDLPGRPHAVRRGQGLRPRPRGAPLGDRGHDRGPDHGPGLAELSDGGGHDAAARGLRRSRADRADLGGDHPGGDDRDRRPDRARNPLAPPEHRRPAARQLGRPAEDAALAMLRERFARGEIDATEFEERKRILGG